MISINLALLALASAQNLSTSAVPIVSDEPTAPATSTPGDLSILPINTTSSEVAPTSSPGVSILPTESEINGTASVPTISIPPTDSIVLPTANASSPVPSIEPNATATVPTAGPTGNATVPTVGPTTNATLPTATYSNTSLPTGGDTTVTTVVTAYTTYCPEPTTFTEGHSTYTVTEPTTLTITDCPCTLTVGPTTITTAITETTTYCPEPTEITYTGPGGSVGTTTVTQPATVTIPCDTTATITTVPIPTPEGPSGAPGTETPVTTHITEYTTYCPEPTEITYTAPGGSTGVTTVTEPATVTVPCDTTSVVTPTPSSPPAETSPESAPPAETTPVQSAPGEEGPSEVPQTSSGGVQTANGAVRNSLFGGSLFAIFALLA